MKPIIHMGLLAMVLAVAACGGKPVDPDLIGQPDEIPPGPGLLTGESGEYAVGVDLW